MGLHDPFTLGTIVRAVPTTESQRELWLSVRVGGDPASCAFNESIHIDLTGSLDASALERAFGAVIERHDALRAVLTPDGQAMCILAAMQPELPLLDLGGVSEATQQERVRELFAREVREPFDLERGPLFRARLVRLSAERHLFVFTAHHVVFDGWSAAVLLSDLGAFYEAYRSGVQPALLPAPSFADYALAERSADYRVAERVAEAFWLSQYEGDVPQTDFPAERRRPDLRSFEAERIDWEVNPEVLAALRAFGSRSGATFVATLFAAFGAYTSRLTGRSDVVIGMPSAGQAATGEHSLVGHCVNTLPLRCRFDLTKPFTASLAAIRSSLLEGQEHREFGFGTLVQRLRIARDPSRLPLVSILFNIDVAISGNQFDGLEARILANPRAYENFEISLNAVDYGDRLVLETTYNTNVFAPAEMKRRLEGFTAMLADLVQRPEVPLGQLTILGEAERQLLDGFSPPFGPAEEPLPVHRLFAERARSNPEAIAVVTNEETLGYGELRARAARFARLLIQEGVNPGSRVAVCLERRADLLVALLGILEAGAAYIPVDPAYPKRRIEMILEDARPDVVLFDEATAGCLPALGAAPSLDLDQALARAAALDASDVGLPVPGEALAYVIFTSGSTGRPKGVQIPHSALSNFIRSMAKNPGFGEGQRLLAVTTISFDIAALELFLPLTTGGAVRLLRQDAALDATALRRVLESEQVDVLQATPATFRMLIDAGWRGNRRIKLLCGGEPFPVDLAQTLLPRCGELYNMYGPTETTVWSTLHRVDSVEDKSVPIGRPIDRTRVYVLDAELQQVPIGVEGDLYIGGDGLARGYHERPDLTTAAFLSDPFVVGARIYRTGDRARWLPDGTLDHRGRSDSQVKVRGFRIELGEIETALAEIAGVKEVAVLVREDTPGDKRLVAYLTYDGEAPLEGTALRERLGERLPRYMLPSAFVLLESMPLTPARKIDKRALPIPSASASSSAREHGRELSRDDDEAALVDMFRELLGVAAVGPSSDFFELGGHSLLAIQLAARIGAFFGVEFSVGTVFRDATVEGLAKAGRERTSKASGERSALVRLSRGTAGPKLFFVCGINVYAEVAQEIGEPYDAFGVFDAHELVYLDQNDAKDLPSDFTAEELARRYLATIRQAQPHGPYCLAGVSFGGVLAYEIAQQLLRAGEEVSFLGLLDPILPRAVSSRGSDFVAHYVRKFARLAPKERLSYVETLARDLLRRPSAPSRRTPPTIAERREAAYEVALGRYDASVRPFAGSAVLFRATDRAEYGHARIAADNGWGKLVRKLEVFDIPGDHLGILRGASAQQIAGIVRQRLAQVPAPRITSAPKNSR